MFEAVAIMGGLGLLVGAGLAAASKIFYVYVDPQIAAIDDALPGANCGGCGFPGCTPNAEAIAAGKSSPGSCVAAGIETAEAIASILGVAIEAKEPDIARSGCYYGYQDADTKFLYQGLSDCRAAALLNGGMKVCTIGCLGLASCVRACPFDAIRMDPDNLPVVDATKCTGCGTCERVCPKHIITLSSVTRRILREYTDDECTTPCQRACPAGIDIKEYIHQISRGDYFRSVQVVKERNPFPTVIGRICPRPCETDCRRNMVDDPIAINYLKRFAADFEKKSGQHIQPYKAPRTGRKIAVVGGGVEGLSTAYFSARIGHDATVYEATPHLGGLLRTAITRERLPDDILQWDIEGILDMGVMVQTEQALGNDFTISSLLKEGYDTVFIATGGWDNRLIRLSGDEFEEQIPGTYLLIDLIKADTGRSSRLSTDKRVVIAGGGRAGLEAAKICRDLGSEQITVLFREAEERELHPEAIKLMQEVENYKEIEVKMSTGLHRIFGENNRLTAVECVDVKTGEKTRLPAHNLFMAAGRFPELIFAASDAEDMPAKPAEETVYWTGILPYKRPDHKDALGAFTEADPITDYSAAIRAIGAGRRGAVSIHRLMFGIPLELDDKVLTPDSCIQDVDIVKNVQPAPRQIMPIASSRELAENSELERGYTESMAIKEANRCLQCGLICYERSLNVPIGIVGEPEPESESAA